MRDAQIKEDLRAPVEFILGRRSIRRFEAGRAVPRALVKLLLECACAAPSARNEKPWHFVVISDRAVLDSLSRTLVYGRMLASAPLAIAVCGETERCGAPLLQWEEDCSAAMENILLAANASGLGAVWLGVRYGADEREDKVRRLLGVPDNIGIPGIAAVGWPAESHDPHSGIGANVMHLNKW